MKFASRILLISALALGPVGCNRSAPDQQVSANGPSANGPNDTYTERTTPQQDRQTTRQNTQPQTNRTTRPADRPADRAPATTAEVRTETRIENRADIRNDKTRPSDRSLEIPRTRTVATVASG